MSPEPTLTDREEKIKRIYEVIADEWTLADTKEALIDIKQVMIWDVLDYLWWWIAINIESNDYWYVEVYKDWLSRIKTLEKRNRYREPLEEQSDECIDYIDSLIASTK